MFDKVNQGYYAKQNQLLNGQLRDNKRQTATAIVLKLLESDSPYWVDLPSELVKFAWQLTDELYAERKSAASQLNNSAQTTEEI